MSNNKEALLNPVEILATAAGILIVAIGIPVSQQPGFTAIMGSILSVLGALLSSATAAWVIARKQSSTQFREQLVSIQRHLHATISKMQSAVSDGLDDDSGEERLALIKIQELTDGLKVVLADISGLSDLPLDLDRVRFAGILDEVRELQSAIDQAVEVEKSETVEHSTDAILVELQEKVGAVVEKVSKLPGQSMNRHTPPVQLSRLQKCLATMRKLNMQHLGPIDQLRLLEKIYEVLISNREFRPLRDITSASLAACASESLTRTKVAGVLRILTFSDVLELETVTAPDGNVPLYLYRIRERFKNCEEVIESHDTCVLAFADYYNVPYTDITSYLVCAGHPIPSRQTEQYVHLHGKVQAHLATL